MCANFTEFLLIIQNRTIISVNDLECMNNLHTFFDTHSLYNNGHLPAAVVCSIEQYAILQAAVE